MINYCILLRALALRSRVLVVGNQGKKRKTKYPMNFFKRLSKGTYDYAGGACPGGGGQLGTTSGWGQPQVAMLA